MSSAGVVLTNTFGIVLGSSGRPGSAAFTSLKLSSFGSFPKLSGNFPAGFHGPLTSVAVSQLLLFRRNNVLVGTCWNRSQLVLTANLRSLSLMGLQIGSPSRLTSTAGDVL